MTVRIRYPAVVDAKRVGTYSALAKAGGGYVWDEVLEYRVWCHPAEGGDDYYYAFATYAKALACSKREPGAEEPLALVLQREYIDEPTPGAYKRVRKKRVTEWPVEFLRRPRRTRDTIPDFLAPDAPANRLDIIRGLAKPATKRKAAAKRAPSEKRRSATKRTPAGSARSTRRAPRRKR